MSLVSIQTRRERSDMRQVHLIASGAQAWNKNVLDVSGERFAYCSTLSIYVHASNGELETLVAGQDRTITGFVFSPHDADLAATCSADLRLSVWRLSTERCEQSRAVDSPPVQIDWCKQVCFKSVCFIRHAFVTHS